MPLATYLQKKKDLEPYFEVVRKGGLLGKTAQEHGYEVTKETLRVGKLTVPKWLQTDFKTADSEAYFKIYTFFLSDQKNRYKSAIILEVYSPGTEAGTEFKSDTLSETLTYGELLVLFLSFTEI